MRTRVKICGIRDPHTAGIAVEAGADALGVVLVAGSPRQVSLKDALRIHRRVPREIPVVAVVSASDRWSELLPSWPGVVQVHGPLNGVDAIAPPSSTMIIRGFSWSPEAAVRWNADPSVAALLIDGPSGGSGAPFDHGALASISPALRLPIIVAGGLRAESVGSVIERVRPYGVDVSSGVESAPGVKDPGAIRAFCDAVRRADEAGEEATPFSTDRSGQGRRSF